MDRASFTDAEDILAAKRISVSRLCRRAEIAESTWHRLREGKVGSAKAATMERLEGAFLDLTGEPWPGSANAEAA